MLALSHPDSVLEVISQIWGKEGVFGVWKGTNSTFVYGVLLRTIETWLRSCFSALLDLPDPGLFQPGIRLQGVGSPGILDSPNPAMSVAVVVLAAGMAGYVLSPIDMVRTRLILTPVTRGPRALIPSLRALPSFACARKLVPITLLHSALPPLVTASTRLLLKAWLRIDPVLTPASYSVSSFFIAITDLFVRLPLETVLRRGHIAVLSSSAALDASRSTASILPLHSSTFSQRFRTIVPVGPYKGIVGSIYHIIHEEGQRIPASLPPPPSTPSSRGGKSVDSRLTKPRRGQGPSALWRGYKVGLWGVFGAWAALGIGGGQAGGEF
jgi:fusion and transport protein UGO1